MEADLREVLRAIAARRRVAITAERYATFGPARFDTRSGALLEELAAARRLRTRPVVAAAGHASVLVAPLCPSAMVFVPSRGGIIHNQAEYTGPEHLAAGAQVLLDAVVRLAS